MSAYVIVEFTVKDPEMYREKYAPIAGQTAKEHGGEVVAAGNWQVLHGDGSLRAITLRNHRTGEAIARLGQRRRESRNLVCDPNYMRDRPWFSRGLPRHLTGPG